MKRVFYKLSKHHSGKGQSQKIILVRLNESVVGFQSASAEGLTIGTITSGVSEKRRFCFFVFSLATSEGIYNVSMGFQINALQDERVI